MADTATIAPSQVMAISDARTNAELMVQCRQLGYLSDEWRILDPTFGKGAFWRLWTPTHLHASDLDPARSPATPADFTALPHPTGSFDAVVFDPPYKLNGTSAHPSDDAYGVAGPAVSWQGRHQLIRDGITECVRVLRIGGCLLVKCQDQVCSGQVRWQTREFADHAEAEGCVLVDQIHLLGHRPQPAGRRQMHARRNYSTLLVFQLAHRPAALLPFAAGGSQ